MNTAYNWPAPAPVKAAPVDRTWGKVLLWVAGLSILGFFAFALIQGDTGSKSRGGSFYAAPGWTIQRAADLSLKIEYDEGTSRARADCTMKAIIGGTTWFKWTSLSQSGQLTVIRTVQGSC